MVMVNSRDVLLRNMKRIFVMQRPYREQDAPTTVSYNKNNYNALPLQCTTTHYLWYFHSLTRLVSLFFADLNLK